MREALAMKVWPGPLVSGAADFARRMESTGIKTVRDTALAPDRFKGP